MSKSKVIVLSVIQQGLSKAEVARKYDVSWRWVHTLVTRYEKDGLDGLEPRSKRPHTTPLRINDEMREKIIALRGQLIAEGNSLPMASMPDPNQFAIGSKRMDHKPRPAPPSAASSPPPDWSPPNPKRGPNPPTFASKPTNPTKPGNQISPTGASPMAPTLKSSTGSMTTPDCS
jgi:hypothetical protein